MTSRWIRRQMKIQPDFSPFPPQQALLRLGTVIEQKMDVEDVIERTIAVVSSR